MSISTEIARLQQAKEDLATSITNKGVTVPAATTIDGYAALVDSISGGGVNMYDEMDAYMYILTPYNPPYDTNYGALFNFVPGKTYKIIVKCRVSTGAHSLFTYQGNANTPNVRIMYLSGTITETTYTHNEDTTYTRIGIYTSNSSYRSSNYACAVYIKEI